MKKVIVFFVVLLTIFACEKNIESSIEGKYIGVTYSEFKRYSDDFGLYVSDTIYADTFIVKLIGDDSIYIKNGISINEFLKNEDNIYGSSNVRNGIKYEFRNDSLFYDARSFSGAGSAYRSTMTAFKGSKSN